MATFNMFEGSRRLALLVKVLWVICVALGLYLSSPSVTLRFATTHPNGPFTITEEQCTAATEASERVTRSLDDDSSIYVDLCFKSRVFESNQQRLVPYRVEKDTLWGNGPYSTEVRAYTAARAEAFRLTAADQAAAHASRDAQWSRNLGYAALFAIGGWTVLSLLQMLLGWIVRGFLGIPLGQDHRQARAAGGAASHSS